MLKLKENIGFYTIVVAIGCPDMDKPDYTWMERKGDTLKMGCSENNDEWTLKCRGNHWIGISRKCVQKSDGNHYDKL